MIDLKATSSSMLNKHCYICKCKYIQSYRLGGAEKHCHVRTVPSPNRCHLSPASTAGPDEKGTPKKKMKLWHHKWPCRGKGSKRMKLLTSQRQGCKFGILDQVLKCPLELTIWFRVEEICCLIFQLYVLSWCSLSFDWSLWSVHIT